jgi:hypothetical protein
MRARPALSARLALLGALALRGLTTVYAVQRPAGLRLRSLPRDRSTPGRPYVTTRPPPIATVAVFRALAHCGGRTGFGIGIVVPDVVADAVIALLWGGERRSRLSSPCCSSSSSISSSIGSIGPVAAASLAAAS